MSNLATLATRYARRPLLLTPEAAEELAQRIYMVDHRAFERPGRVEALIRTLAGRARRAHEMDDEAIGEPLAFGPGRPMAYSPLWAQQTYGEPQFEGYGWALYDGVALMEINGPLNARGEYFCGEWYHGYDTLLAAHREAVADERVRAIFTVHNSPGGVVSPGLDELATFIRENRESAGGKPMWAFCDMAASADYYLVSQCDRVLAAPVSLVGSIGAVWIHQDWSDADKKAGVQVTPVQFGAKKTDGASFKPLSPEAKADIQAEVDQCGRDFVAAVVAGRSQLSEETILGTQAAIFMGDHDDAARSALQIGLIDALATEEQAFMALVDHLAPSPAPLAASQPSIVSAQARPRAPKASKEPPMTRRTAVASASPTALDALRADRARLDAEIAAAEAETAAAPAEATEATAETDPCETCEGTGEVEGGECEACGGSGIDPEAGPGAESPERNDDGTFAAAPDATPDAEATAQAERTLIMNSAEAEAHPHAALAAVRDGLTFAQFKGQLEAASKAPKGGRGALADALRGSPRLGPDAAAKTKGSLFDVAMKDARAKAEAAATPKRH